MFITGFIQGREYCTLDVEVLEHRFNTKVGRRVNILYSNHSVDVCKDFINLFFRENPSFNCFSKEIRDDSFSPFHPLFFTVDHLDLEILLRGFLSDSGTHVSSTYHCNTIDGFHGLATSTPFMNTTLLGYDR